MQGIYKITCKVNGKIYIGQSVNIETRFKSHMNNFKNENLKNILIITKKTQKLVKNYKKL